MLSYNLFQDRSNKYFHNRLPLSFLFWGLSPKLVEKEDGNADIEKYIFKRLLTATREVKGNHKNPMTSFPAPEAGTPLKKKIPITI